MAEHQREKKGTKREKKKVEEPIFYLNKKPGIRMS